jgi:2-succinyl-5-enolpyruvyl-6-hydroxy-3-cyclohexene-1-carboxylate synthase
VFFQQLAVSETQDYKRAANTKPVSFLSLREAQKSTEDSNPSDAADSLAPGNPIAGEPAETNLTWQQVDTAAAQFLADFFITENQPFNEFSAMHRVLAGLLEGTALHLANSMAVRYANIIGPPEGKQVEVFANRGTSGIDGCTSTALGAALAQPARPVVLLTGDMAFFYDRNAFWHNYPTPNLRVVLFNNHGGGIFRLIDGPRQQPELDEFFETHQALTAENLCHDFNLHYLPVASFAELEAALPVFFADESGATVLEIFTDSKTNAAFFEEYRKAVKAAF